MKRLNFKSDFDFILRLQSCNCVDIGFPDCDWVARFWTSSRSMVYEASCIGGVCQNCYNDSGQIHIVMDNHGLGIGELQCEFTMLTAEEQFSDGTRKTVSVLPIDIELVRGGCACPVSAEAVAMIPALKGEKGDTGEKGDSFEFEDLTEQQIAELAQPALEVANDIRNGLEESIEAVDARVDETNQALAQAQEEQSVINERVKHEYVGVWDELDHIKEILASVATHEVHELLSSMGYEEEDIEDYLYFNLHGFISVSMDELRLSAYRWKHRAEFEDSLQLAVMPMWQEEWETDGYDFSDLFEYECKYCPKFVFRKDIIFHNPYPRCINFVNKLVCIGEVINIADSDHMRLPKVYSISGNFTQFNNPKSNSENWDIYNFIPDNDRVIIYYKLSQNRLQDMNIRNFDFSKIAIIEDGAFRDVHVKNLNLPPRQERSNIQIGMGVFNGTTLENSNVWVILDSSVNGNNCLNSTILYNSTIGLYTKNDCNNGTENIGVSPIGNYNDDSCAILYALGEIKTLYNFGFYCPYTCINEGGPFIISAPQLTSIYVYTNQCVRSVLEGDLYYNNFLKQRNCIFYRDIGYNPEMNVIPAAALFSMHNDINHPYIRLFVDLAKTWANRKELGYNPIDVHLTTMQLAGMTDEEKAMLTDKGYNIIEINFG